MTTMHKLYNGDVFIENILLLHITKGLEDNCCKATVETRVILKSMFVV